jgi:hypothetical protein
MDDHDFAEMPWPPRRDTVRALVTFTAVEEREPVLLARVRDSGRSTCSLHPGPRLVAAGRRQGRLPSTWGGSGGAMRGWKFAMELAAVFAVTGCEPVHKPGHETGPPGTTDTTPAPACAEASIGAGGGEVVGDGIRVVVPLGALAVQVTVSVCPAAAPAGVDVLRNAWTVEAVDGALELAVPATVTLDGFGEDEPALFVPDPDGAPVRSLQASAPSVGAVEGPLYRAGVVYAALDDRRIEAYQGGSGAVDALFVVDDSGSMADNQAHLADEFATALPLLLGSGIDFHAGVVTTDLDRPTRQGRLIEVDGHLWVDASTPDAVAVFAEMAQAGTSGSGTEQGLGAVYLALDTHADTYNTGFQRPEASLAVVVVSDEDDATSSGFVSVQEVIDWLLLARVPPASTALHAIVNPPGGGVVNPPGDRYVEVAFATGGEAVSILSEDWSGVFTSIIDAAGDPAGMALAVPAEPDSVEVWSVPAAAEPERVDATYDPVGNTVQVEPGGPPGDLVVLYRPL